MLELCFIKALKFWMSQVVFLLKDTTIEQIFGVWAASSFSFAILMFHS
jgi:hypothetical protein